MRQTNIQLHWSREFRPDCFRTGVSLHSHTLHSRESLDFVYGLAQRSRPVRTLLGRAEADYLRFYEASLDLDRGWWTPPLAPLEAYMVESEQIRALGLNPLVSLTDHDDIEAPTSLQAIDATRKVPISVEWTVPFQNATIHLGIHNLPPLRARSIMARLQEFTARPEEAALKEILAGLSASPGILIVFNHPLWDEKSVGNAVHRAAALNLLAQCGEYIHAIELNGLRPWNENQQALLLAHTWSKPVVSGGDRHALEPNAVLNLTNAAGFSDFAAEVRDGYSQVLITSYYREPYRCRMIQNIWDVIRPYENHGRGWREWQDRVFYTFEDGEPKSFSQIWGADPPPAAAVFTKLLRLAARMPLRQALRAAAWRAEQVVL